MTNLGSTFHSLEKELNDTIQLQEEHRELLSRGKPPSDSGHMFIPHHIGSLVAKLKSRNALAEEEADYLSQFNAHILGHANVNQRIYYVDRIRKDLSDAKQVSTFLLLRTAIHH